jgi:hypothetical protein
VKRAVFGICLLTVVGVAAAGAEWERRLGEAKDPGPVVFASLVRSNAGSDALICPVSLCLRTAPDLEPPVFTSSAAELEKELTDYARRAAGVDRISVAVPGTYRFVERLSAFTAPLFVDVLVEPLSSGAATVAIYARGADRRSRAVRLDRARAWLSAFEN